VRSVVYNLAAVAAALAGFVTPLVAAVLMPLSSSIVAWSALRVRRQVDGNG
jgi:cation transport ATPase